MNDQIAASVGLAAVNSPDDVLVVQKLLNTHRHRMVGVRELAEDRVVGPRTVDAIMRFQREVVGLRNPDGRIDPGGKTFRVLSSAARAKARPAPPPPSSNLASVTSPLLFPLRRRPQASYKTNGRQFGAQRDKGRRSHAGCDLLATPGTEILAMDDGVVNADAYYFYSGTNALEICHSGGWIARYGEISGVATGLKKGSQVKRGQVIAYVGQLDSGCSMLHLEFYSGTGSGNLTVRANPPYQRRADLVDPTPLLDAAQLA